LMAYQIRGTRPIAWACPRLKGGPSSDAMSGGMDGETKRQPSARKLRWSP
jgi:hypothetical protein